MTAIFWICLSLILYVYVGYPLLLASGLLGRRRSAKRGACSSTLSVVVPAHNEAAGIRLKILNLLGQDYPRDKVEMLIGNDGSKDETADIIREFASSGVRLVNSPAQLGKSAIQNRLVAESRGEILVFTDADCLLPAQALSVLAEHFVDPEVGLITNCAAIQNEDETPVVENEGLYWRYERWLREQESARGLLAMASGSLFAMRRNLWARLDPDVGDDFALPLRVARAGFRNVLENRVSARTRLSQAQPGSMFRMKTRIISKDLRGLLRNRACLNPLATGRVAIGLWSHKLLRWAIPYFLIGLLISNLLLAGRNLYGVFLALQVAFYAASTAGLLLKSHALRFPISTASSFCLVNAAALYGTLHCLTLQSAGQWKTVR